MTAIPSGGLAGNEGRPWKEQEMEHLSQAGTSSLREMLSTRDANLYGVESGTGS